MKLNHKKQRRGFTLVELLVVIVIIASLAGLTAPMVIRQRKKADQTEATSNARQIGLAMFEFETEYGRFPDAGAGGTEEQVLANNPDGAIIPNASNSNGYFRQLFRANITQSEAMFYAKTGATRKPDGDISNTGALAAGENGFAYIMNVARGLSTAGNPARIIAATPLTQGATTSSPDPFDNRAVVLRIDNSVASVNINAAGQPIIGGGKTLTQNGADTVWGTGITPTVIQPLY